MSAFVLRVNGVRRKVKADPATIDAARALAMLIDGRFVLRDGVFPGVSDVDGVIAEATVRGATRSLNPQACATPRPRLGWHR